MQTIYTFNDKVLKNSVTAKWLAKKQGPSFQEVTIGSQTWMAKSLAIDDGQGGVLTQTVNYGQGDVVEYYYTWEAAIRIANSIPGWHLPTASEWDTLTSTVGGSLKGGTKLKSTYGWNNDGNGTDDYGFAAFPAGQWITGFDELGNYAYFWTATEYSDSLQSYIRYVSSKYAFISSSFYNKSRCYFSVRLIKDAA